MKYAWISHKKAMIWKVDLRLEVFNSIWKRLGRIDCYKSSTSQDCRVRLMEINLGSNMNQDYSDNHWNAYEFRRKQQRVVGCWISLEVKYKVCRGSGRIDCWNVVYFSGRRNRLTAMNLDLKLSQVSPDNLWNTSEFCMILQGIVRWKSSLEN